jgi:hypothetical protein
MGKIMDKPLSRLCKKIKPAVLAAADKKAKKLLAAIPPQELCHARQLPQEQLADTKRKR